MNVGSSLLEYAGVVLMGAAAFLLGWSVLSHRQSLASRLWARYEGHLEKRLRDLFLLQLSGGIIVRGQLCGIVVVIAAATYWGSREICAVLPVVVLGPVLTLERLRVLRIRAVELGMDAFIMTLANALKATPSIGNALAYAQPLLSPPLNQELGLALKEVRVGSTVDEALMNMGSRVRSLPLDATLSSILIGRQVGGDLVSILETTATTLREMARLHGVLRTKTAEGKGQLVVLAVFPGIIVLGFDLASPGYFDPLTASVTGYVVVVISICLWVGAVAVARKVLAVDL